MEHQYQGDVHWSPLDTESTEVEFTIISGGIVEQPNGNVAELSVEENPTTTVKCHSRQHSTVEGLRKKASPMGGLLVAMPCVKHCPATKQSNPILLE